MEICDLSNKNCKPCEGGVAPLGQAEAQKLLTQLEGWHFQEKYIVKSFQFKNYFETMAFINAGAWISHQEDHHPDISFSYKQCTVSYTTHAIGGLSENDFICAAKIDFIFNK